MKKHGGKRDNSGRKKLWTGGSFRPWLPLWLKEEFYTWRAGKLRERTLTEENDDGN